MGPPGSFHINRTNSIYSAGTKTAMAITRDTKKTRDAVATQSEFVGIGDGAKPTVPQDVLDLELFEELRDLLGHEETKAALKELLSTLKNNFPDISAADLDREEVHVRVLIVTEN